jgi:hypothetical protein
MRPAVHRPGPRVATAGMLCMILASYASAQVTRIEITAREPLNGGQAVGGAGPYEVLRGRVHGEVDPRDPHNAIIQDLQLAPRNARGKVEYVATFALAKPVDSRHASGVLIYQVVNRGNGTVTPSPDGHFSLVSGWQGDLAPSTTNQTIEVPLARHADGAPVTGPVLARFYNVAAGTTTMAIRLSSMAGSRPVYPPAALDERTATLSESTAESATGVKATTRTVPRAAWAFADCRTTAFPGVPDPERVCLRDGFDPAKLYELVYTAKDPLVLGIGLAATRDINAFFRHADRDEAGTANPISGLVRHVISIGDSQSGNFIKTFVHLGFNQDLANRIVWDGVFPRIAARQTPMNFRFASPGGAATLYEPGSEPVVWWAPYQDSTRQRPLASLLDRCHATNTCPRIIEAFGSSEFWGLRMSPGLIGTDAKRDIPLPDNVRRYYYPGTTHGGGRGGFAISADTAPQSGCALPLNPNPESDTTRALTEALVAWVADDRPPPASRYPRLDAGELIPAATAARRFPTVPQYPLHDAAVNPVLEYDFGPAFVANDMTGVIARLPPRIVRVIPTYVPDVDADGNEMAGVRSVLHQVPLGTYLGWNITASGFFKGQACGFNGGYVPFAKTQADRLRAGDPRRSVEERYGTLEGYVCGVERAVTKAIADRFLLTDDGARLLDQAQRSGVLPTAAESSGSARETAQRLCGRALP